MDTFITKAQFDTLKTNLKNAVFSDIVDAIKTSSVVSVRYLDGDAAVHAISDDKDRIVGYDYVNPIKYLINLGVSMSTIENLILK